jgi:3'-phosphoadenosine 5'-phosphosulfate sulfotransferase (PAPS reductase)/FAD synthetase
MLGRKQSISNDDWIHAAANIKNTVAEADISILEKQTISEIKEKIKGKKSAYAWSGGKDSIVLGAICEKAGVTDCMIGICNLEYPAFINWINENKPAGLETVNTGQDMAWLSKHPEMLFPGAATASKWYAIVQHRAQEKYVRERQIDVIMLGRRKADGNYVGKGDNIYTAKNITRYSPLSDWTHEQVLAYIAYNNLPLPPRIIMLIS